MIVIETNDKNKLLFWNYIIRLIDQYWKAHRIFRSIKIVSQIT